LGQEVHSSNHRIDDMLRISFGQVAQRIGQKCPMHPCQIAPIAPDGLPDLAEKHRTFRSGQPLKNTLADANKWFRQAVDALQSSRIRRVRKATDETTCMAVPIVPAAAHGIGCDVRLDLGLHFRDIDCQGHRFTLHLSGVRPFNQPRPIHRTRFVSLRQPASWSSSSSHLGHFISPHLVMLLPS
jgi:hypothetical protein